MNPIIFTLIGFVIGAVATWMARNLFTKIHNDGWNSRSNDLTDLDALLSPGEAFGQKRTHQRNWDEVCERWTKREKEGMI